MNAFISYAHDDADAGRLFEAELREAARLVSRPVTSVWVDRMLNPGEWFRREIANRIRTSNIAFLLISDRFFASEFIRKSELPSIQEMVDHSEMVMLPIKVGDFDELEYDKVFKDLQAWPTINGRLVSIEKIPAGEKERVYADLHRYAVAAAELRHTKLIPKNPDLSSGPKRRDVTEKLVQAYKDKHEEEVIHAVAYLYWHLWEIQKQEKDAKDFATEFHAELERKGVVLDGGHKPTMDLLEAGLPGSPTHLKLLEVASASQLLKPDFARLLLGMRITELDYFKAKEFFEGLYKLHPVFKKCSLIEYALGQCARKINEDFVGAGTRFAKALKRCSPWKDKCECPGLSCPKGMLLVEIHRGLGALYRKMEKREKALEHFHEAEEHIVTRKDVSTFVKADFRFSFGYFLLEDAVKEAVRSKSWALTDEKREQLNQARAKFEQSIQDDEEFPAPPARLEMVKKLLGDFDSIGWTQSRNVCAAHSHGEPVLTTILCEFALRLYALNTGDSLGPSSKTLYNKLAEVFESTEIWPSGIPLGPIKCHFFDMEVVRWDASIESDAWLTHTFDLLSESRNWTSEDHLYDIQVQKLHEFEKKRGIERGGHPPLK